MSRLSKSSRKRQRYTPLFVFSLILVLALSASATYLPYAPMQYNDSLFRVYDNGDATKLLAFELSGITTGTTRTIYIGDADGNTAEWNDAYDHLAGAVHTELDAWIDDVTLGAAGAIWGVPTYNGIVLDEGVTINQFQIQGGLPIEKTLVVSGDSEIDQDVTEDANVVHGQVTVDNIDIDGSTITLTGDSVLDGSADIHLDAVGEIRLIAGSYIEFKTGGDNDNYIRISNVGDTPIIEAIDCNLELDASGGGSIIFSAPVDFQNENMTNVDIDTGDIATAVTNTKWDAAYTHAGDSSQAHTDYLINNGDDSTSGWLTSESGFKAADGNSAVPSYTFGTDLDTGIYSDAGNTIRFSLGGINALTLTGNVFNSFYYSNMAFLGPTFNFQRAKGTQGTPLAVTTDCALLTIGGYGYMGSDYIAGGAIRMFAESNWSSGDCPTRMSFWTVPDGSSTIAERMRIDNAGNVRIGAGAPEAKLQVVGDCMFGDDTNDLLISGTGDLSFGGSAGFYPRFLTQADEPASGTGATQCDPNEMVVWKDSDDNTIHLCFNDGGTVKTVELQ